MHPFCCVSPISHRNNQGPVSSGAPPFSSSSMPSSAHSLSTDAPALHSNGNAANHHHTNNQIQIQNQSNHNNNNTTTNNHHSNNQHQQITTSVDQRVVRINDIVGNGICGILYKWVNYGKGWRPRWFVLQDGVVSYYKIHGPDKITLSLESEKGFKVIGDESMRRIRRPNLHSSSRRKPFGEGFVNSREQIR